jgi:hypothetical protein
MFFLPLDSSLVAEICEVAVIICIRRDAVSGNAHCDDDPAPSCFGWANQKACALDSQDVA